MISSRWHAPGKLFIAGEYGVVTPGQPAVLIALDRGIDCVATLDGTVHEPLARSADRSCDSSNESSASRADSVGRAGALADEARVRIMSPSFPGGEVSWTPLSATSQDSGEMREPACRALDVLHDYLREIDRTMPTMTVTLTSTLVDRSGRKYGFGSSGAVVVAIVGAVSTLLGLSLTHEELIKLSTLAVLEGDRRASCADVATSVVGGWVMYRSPNRDHLYQVRRTVGVREVLAMPWQGWEVSPLQQPEGLRLVIGWSGQPASTRDLVASVDSLAESDGYDEGEFLESSSSSALRLARAFEEEDGNEAMDAVRDAGAALALLDSALSQHGGPLVETPELARMRRSAEECGAVAKLSGAGGGDCAIALASSPQQEKLVREAWAREGYEVLHVAVAPRRQPREETA